MSLTGTDSAVSLPFGRRLAGALDTVVFTGAMTPHDLETGRLVRSTADVPEAATAARYGAMFIDVPGDAALAQAWQAYANLEQILADQGVPMSALCRQRVMVRDLRDVPLIERVMDLFFDSSTVATSIVEISGDNLDDAVRVQVEGAAAIGDAAKTVHRSDELDAVTGRYPAMVQVGQFAFISAMAGINPATGRPADGPEELGEDAGLFDMAPYRSARQRAVLSQTWFSYQHVRAALELGGGKLADILKVTGWLDYAMRDFDPMRPVRTHLFPEVSQRVASTALRVGPGTTEGAVLAFDAIAVIDDPQGRDKEVHTDPSLIVPYYVGATAGGGAVFTCGEVPIDEEAPRAVTEPEQLSGEHRLIRFGRIDRPTGIEARASYVYEKLEGHLNQYGSSLSDVVHQTVYLEDMGEMGALEVVSRSVFADGLPATTTVPIGETSPFWQESRLEIEVIARR